VTEGFVMVVAKWEFQALANMLVATHGLEAESEARNRLKLAESNGNSGESVVWSEVLDRLPELIEKYKGQHNQI
jgi:hypothetical protein